MINFWRSLDRKEIDFVITKAGKIEAFECKWAEDADVSYKQFLKAYPEAITKTITPNSLVIKMNKTTS